MMKEEDQAEEDSYDGVQMQILRFPVRNCLVAKIVSNRTP